MIVRVLARVGNVELELIGQILADDIPKPSPATASGWLCTHRLTGRIPDLTVGLARTDCAARLTVCLRCDYRYKVPRISEFIAINANFSNLERLARHLQFKCEHQCANAQRRKTR